MTGIDDLPPMQYLIIDVLIARHRTGETCWTLPAGPAYRRALDALAAAGLVRYKSGPVERTFLVWPAAAALPTDGEGGADGGYVSPLEAELVKARAMIDAYRLVFTDLERGS